MAKINAKFVAMPVFRNYNFGASNNRTSIARECSSSTILWSFYHRTMFTSPADLIIDGILTTHHIYRTAKVNARETDLCTGQYKDDFPELVESSPGQYFLPNCAKSLADGDELTCAQRETLLTWHAGLSCLVHLKLPKHCVVINVFDEGFRSEFENAKGTINGSGRERYQQFLCYELRRGTPIPAGIGIERDGENHVCLYPTGDHSTVSAVSKGQDTFVVDVLKNIVCLWRPFALLKLKASGYKWPATFPPDSGHFQLRRWVETVVICGEADLALAIARSTEEFVSGDISWFEYFTVVLSVGDRFTLVCSSEQCWMTLDLAAAVRFALDFAELSGQDHKSFLLKSTSLNRQPAKQSALVDKNYTEIESGAREALGLAGGLCFVSTAALINVLFVNTMHQETPVLPFTLLIDDSLLLFDAIDPSPVFDCSSEVDSRAPHATSFFGHVDSAATADQSSVQIVESVAGSSFVIALPPSELADVVDQCIQCFGYTLRGSRCHNLRRPVRSKRTAPVWCPHHAAQEVSFHKFLFDGQRPSECNWWEMYDYAEFVKVGGKLSI